jgi:hypothetical protein
VEIHSLTGEVQDEGAVNTGNVRKWCQLLKRFRTNMHDEEQSGRQSLVMDDLKEKVQNARILHKRQFATSHSMQSALIYKPTTWRGSLM